MHIPKDNHHALIVHGVRLCIMQTRAQAVLGGTFTTTSPYFWSPSIFCCRPYLSSVSTTKGVKKNSKLKKLETYLPLSILRRTALLALVLAGHPSIKEPRPRPQLAAYSSSSSSGGSDTAAGVIELRSLCNLGATENARSDIARLDNVRPCSKGGHRETCFSVRVSAH